MNEFTKIANYIKMRLVAFFMSQRPLVVGSYIFLTLFGVFGGIKDVCDLLGYNISMFSYPHLVATLFMRMLVLVGVVLVFLDAPFLDNISENLITKMGKKIWFIANVLYIFIMSAAYTLAYNLGLLIGFLGYQTPIASWGKIITSLSRSIDLMIKYKVKISYSQGIIDKYTPFEAMVHSNLISVLEFAIIGLLIFSISLYFKSNWPGIIFACSYIMMGQLEYLVIPGYLQGLIPTNFLNLGVFEQGSFLWSLNLSQGYMLLIGLSLFLIAIGYRRLKKMDIIIYKGLEI